MSDSSLSVEYGAEGLLKGHGSLFKTIGAAGHVQSVAVSLSLSKRSSKRSSNKPAAPNREFESSARFES